MFTLANITRKFTVDELKLYCDVNARIDNDIILYTVNFSSRVKSSVLIAVPVVDHVSDIVVVAPGTTGLTSDFTVANSPEGIGYCSLYGVRGMISVVVDYPRPNGIQPYLVAEQEGYAVLDAIDAVFYLCAKLDIKTSGKIVLTGISQGGHAVLSACALLKIGSRRNIKGVLVSGPASAFEEHWREGVRSDGSHIPFHVMLMYAWENYYRWNGKSIWSTSFNSSFKNERIYPLAESLQYLEKLSVFSHEFLVEYVNGFEKDFQEFHSWFDANRVKPWKQTCPIRIYQGANDCIVPLKNTNHLVETLSKTMDIDYQVRDADHGDLACGYLAQPQLATEESIDWIRQQFS